MKQDYPNTIRKQLILALICVVVVTGMLLYLMPFWYAYLIGVNLLAIVCYGLDKHLAIKSKQRISEAALLLFAAGGGVIGSIIAQRLFHHKTKKPSFQVKFWAIIIVEIAIAGYIIYKKQSGN